MEEKPHTVGVIGAGTMGAGIAQIAATGGWTVRLMDVDEPTVRAAIEGVITRLDRLVEKGRLSADGRGATAARLRAAASPADLADCELVIEAIVEDLDVKTHVLGGLLPALRDDAIIATNTSSLSVTEIGRAVGAPHRTAGMHFFNPAPLMKLVEVIAGDQTEPAVVDRVAETATGWGKTVARAADVPGFIVNHVARPYYLEAFRILEDGYASVEEIDKAMKTLGGFRMGPLELTDLIGQDVNAAATRSIWRQLGEPPLLRPCPVQDVLIDAGHFGRKTGRGAYSYGGETPSPAIQIDRRPLEMSDGLRAAVDRFVNGATDVKGDDLQRYVFARILVALIAQATLACERGVASRTDIDTALKFGVIYPRGPFEWAERIGRDACDELARQLEATASKAES